jgi:hypothetical protein
MRLLGQPVLLLTQPMNITGWPTLLPAKPILLVGLPATLASQVTVSISKVMNSAGSFIFFAGNLHF